MGDEIVVQVRLLDGKTTKKIFQQSDQIDTVYKWLNTEHNKDGEEFQVLNSYPRQFLSENFRSKTFAQAGFSRQLTLVMCPINAQQANKSKPIEANSKGFFENLFGGNSKDEKKSGEPGFFEKLFAVDKNVEQGGDSPRRSIKDAKTISDTTSRGTSGEIEAKKIKGMHSNVKGFK